MSDDEETKQTNILDQIEEWMTSCELFATLKLLWWMSFSASMPVIGRNEFMINFFKLEENIHLFLEFVL